MRPSPGSRTLSDRVTKLGVGLEVVQVNVVAPVRLVWVVLDSLNTTKLALDDALVGPLLLKAVPPSAVELASSTLLSPGSLDLLASHAMDGLS